MFKGPFDESIIKRAQDKNLVQIQVHDLRNWGLDSRKTVDDRPYGGGVGMIIRVDVIDKALKEIISQATSYKLQATILLDATGGKFNQQKAVYLSKLDHIILIAGHYEGVDHRVHEHLADEVISIGDYILTGGEIPAMVVTDAVCRLIPGVLEKPEAVEFESFSQATSYKLPATYLEHPQYTRPEEYRGWKVPEILLSGDHKKIEKWRNTTSRDLGK